MAYESPPAEKALVQQYKKVTGYVPPMFTDLLHVLAHPDVIEYTKEYLREADQ